ncbi:hypothetical protein K439DRAFT_1641250 [Ramaria rubella]|nr:hypothetical protein K439DRAFT_1641250 [Ramaria rubella]
MRANTVTQHTLPVIPIRFPDVHTSFASTTHVSHRHRNERAGVTKRVEYLLRDSDEGLYIS